MTTPNRDDVIASMKEAAERMGLDLEDLQEMIEDVLVDCSQKSEKLLEAATQGDTEQIRAIAHDIKGSTGNYGLMTANQLALQIEKSCQDMPVAMIKELQTHLAQLATLNLAQS